MDRFLRISLIVTGALAFAVWVAPWLILFGLFALVIPGLILACAPTAFFYGLVFAIGWYLTERRIGAGPASLVGLGLAAAVGIGLPMGLSATSEAVLQAAVVGDTKPAEPVTLTGTVAIRSGENGWPLSAYQKGQPRRPLCDDLCLALLFTPGVTTVIFEVDASNRQDARPTRYSLGPGDLCRGIAPPLTTGRYHTIRSVEADIELAWRIRLATDTCLRQDDATESADMRLAVNSDRSGAPPDLGFGSELWTRRLMLSRGSDLLAQDTYARSSRVAVPLYLEPGNILANRNTGLTWGRHASLRNVQWQDTSLLSYARARTNLRDSTEGMRLGEALRTTLDRALDDPRLPAEDAAFQLVEPYVAIVGRDGAQAGDAARLARLIADRRVKGLGNVSSTLKALGPDAITLRGPIGQRILVSDPATDGEVARQLGRALGNLPPDTFRTLTPDERRLIADPARQPFVLGLICRLADQGADAAEPLTDILVQAYAPPPNPRKRQTRGGDVAEAAMKGLTNLGAAAAPALPRLEALWQSEAVSGHFRESDAWVTMLARAGKPVEDFVKPANRSGTQEQYTARLQHDLQRFTPQRCG